MIRSIVEHIDTQITGFTALGLVENGMTYIGGGDFEHINLDFNEASYYHRINGTVNISQSDDDTVGGEIMTVESYPMRLVSYFPNNFLSDDDSYSALNVVSNLKSKLPANLNTIADTLNLYSVEVVLRGFNMDSPTVWAAEFTVDYNLQSTHRLIYIDYDIILTGKTSCFEDYTC